MDILRRIFAFIALICAGAAPLAAQERADSMSVYEANSGMLEALASSGTAQDSIALLRELIYEKNRDIAQWEWKQKHSFKPEYVIFPSAMIAVGIFGTYNDTFQEVNLHIRSGMKRLRNDRFLHFDDYIQYTPILTYMGFGMIGIKCKHDFKERMAAGLTAYATMAVLVNIGKYSFRILRPDGSTRNSFPSGHSGVVFTGAELMREEYGNGIGAAAYAVAATVGFMRMYNNRHWLTDVIAGAGIGILSARVGYWMLPVWQRAFGWNKGKSSDPVMVAVPAYDPESRGVSMSFAMTF